MKNSLIKSAFFLLFAIGSLNIALANENQQNATASAIYTPTEIKWVIGPDFLPKGTKISLLEGDPRHEGPYTLRLKLPAGYIIPPHFHEGIEHVTIISGSLNIGMGDKFDKKNTTKLTQGSFGFIEPKHHHFAMTENGAVIQLHGIGPFSITYLNPNDDPRNKS